MKDEGGRMNVNHPPRLSHPSSFLLHPSIWAGMPLGATDPCKVGVMGSTPMRSTDDERAHGPTGRHRYGMAVIRVRFPVSPLQ